MWRALPSEFPYPRGTPLAGTFSVESNLFKSSGGYDVAFRFGENSEFLLNVNLILMQSGESTGFSPLPSVLRVERQGRDPDHYSDYRLLAALRMLEKNGHHLLNDRTTVSNHHAIASHQYREDGHNKRAAHHAALAVRYRPS